MKHAWSRWIAACLLLGGMARLLAADVRFSQSLSTEDRAASGLARLSSDEVAVVDALVRRDTATRLSATTDDQPITTFSQRLTADERRIGGLAKLTPMELPKLDALVDRHENGNMARTLLAPPTYLSRTSRVAPTETKKEREIHGSFSLSYGWGSGGYSEKTGGMVLSLEDPAKGYSISVGYSETHVKGGTLYRDPFYYRDPLYYDALRGPGDPLLLPPRP